MSHHLSTGTKQDQTGIIGTLFFDSPGAFDQTRPNSSKFDFIFKRPSNCTKWFQPSKSPASKGSSRYQLNRCDPSTIHSSTIHHPSSLKLWHCHPCLPSGRFPAFLS